jgi:hypothetical protein
MGIIAGATVALVEATVGWGISWWIGPGRPATPISLSRLIRIVAVVTLMGADSDWWAPSSSL